MRVQQRTLKTGTFYLAGNRNFLFGSDTYRSGSRSRPMGMVFGHTFEGNHLSGLASGSCTMPRGVPMSLCCPATGTCGSFSARRLHPHERIVDSSLVRNGLVGDRPPLLPGLRRSA